MPERDTGGRTPAEMILLERFLLNRLTRFARLASGEYYPEEQWKRRLSRAATLSAYRDLASIEMEQEARRILAKTFGSQSTSF